MRAADFIHVLDHGRVVESGTFTDLLSDEVDGPKIFRGLYQLQAAQYATEAPAVPSQNGHAQAQGSAKGGLQ